MTVKAEDIVSLVELFQNSSWDELHVEIDGLQLFLSTDPNARLTSGAAQPPPAVVPTPVAATAMAGPPAESTRAGQAAVRSAETVPAHWFRVTAPNLGTFFRGPKPGAPPFVELGQSVQADTELCLLEVMKLFTAVTAGIAGVIRQVCVNDGEMVEHGQTLFLIEPA
jgi:acetyl-CoA carboxylase biotin carboxyl carrier protein